MVQTRIFHPFASAFKEQQFRELKHQLLEKGEDCLNSLYICLMNDGKIDEMKKVMHDRDYRQELYKIYGL